MLASYFFFFFLHFFFLALSAERLCFFLCFLHFFVVVGCPVGPVRECPATVAWGKPS